MKFSLLVHAHTTVLFGLSVLLANLYLSIYLITLKKAEYGLEIFIWIMLAWCYLVAAFVDINEMVLS